MSYLSNNALMTGYPHTLDSAQQAFDYWRQQELATTQELAEIDDIPEWEVAEFAHVLPARFIIHPDYAHSFDAKNTIPAELVNSADATVNQYAPTVDPELFGDGRTAVMLPVWYQDNPAWGIIFYPINFPCSNI